MCYRRVWNFTPSKGFAIISSAFLHRTLNVSYTRKVLISKLVLSPAQMPPSELPQAHRSRMQCHWSSPVSNSGICTTFKLATILSTACTYLRHFGNTANASSVEPLLSQPRPAGSCIVMPPQETDITADT